MSGRHARARSVWIELYIVFNFAIVCYNCFGERSSILDSSSFELHINCNLSNYTRVSLVSLSMLCVLEVYRRFRCN